MKIFDTIELRLIAAWREVWGFWSVRLNALGLTLLSFCQLVTETWNSMPDELRQILPYARWVSVGLFAVGFAARFIAQPKTAAAVVQKQQETGDGR